jgi:outer membrane protein
MMKSRLFAAVAAAAALAAPALAHAADSNGPEPMGQGTLLVTARVTDVFSDAHNPINLHGGGPTGLHVDIGNSVMPTLGITYFLTDNISAEVILGETSHDITAKGKLLGVTPTDLKIANTWVLPPVVTLQYRPLGKSSTISPYIGAGVNVMMFNNVSNKVAGFNTHLSDSVGGVVQVGVDAPITKKFTVNVDVKKVFVTTHAEVDTVAFGPLDSHVHLDPWIISAGVGYRFF